MIEGSVSSVSICTVLTKTMICKEAFNACVGAPVNCFLGRHGRGRDQQVPPGPEGVHPGAGPQRGSPSLQGFQADTGPQRLLHWGQEQNLHDCHDLPRHELLWTHIEHPQVCLLNSLAVPSVSHNFFVASVLWRNTQLLCLFMYIVEHRVLFPLWFCPFPGMQTE